MVAGLKIEDKKFIRSKDASKLSGYAPDYIGQLCRGGKLECKRIGRSWFVEETSLVKHCQTNGNDKPLTSPAGLANNVVGFEIEEKERVYISSTKQEVEVKNEVKQTVEVQKPVLSLSSNSGKNVNNTSPYFSLPNNFSKKTKKIDPDFWHKIFSLTVSVTLVTLIFFARNSVFADDVYNFAKNSFKTVLAFSSKQVDDLSNLSLNKISSDFSLGFKNDLFSEKKDAPVSNYLLAQVYDLGSKTSFGFNVIKYASVEIRENPFNFAKNTLASLYGRVYNLSVGTKNFALNVPSKIFASISNTKNIFNNAFSFTASISDSLKKDPLFPVKEFTKNFTQGAKDYLNAGKNLIADLFVIDEYPKQFLVVYKPDGSKKTNL
jgi:hypothetical protein